MAKASIRPRRAALAYIGFYAIAGSMWLFVDRHPLAVLIATAMTLPVAPVAYGLWQVERGAWLALHAHTALMCGTGVVLALGTPPLAPAGILMVLNALLVSALYFRADARLPFLSSNPRGFRRYPRYPANLAVRLQIDGRRKMAETHDLSSGGAYLIVDPSGFRSGQRLSVEFIGRGSRPPITLWARVVGAHTYGVGIKPAGVSVRFVEATGQALRSLRDVMRASRRDSRVLINLPIRISNSGGRGLAAQTRDLSTGGCYVLSLDRTLTVGRRVTLALGLHEGDEVALRAVVVRRQEAGDAAHPAGVAFRFLDVSDANHARLRGQLSEARVRGTERPVVPVPEEPPQSTDIGAFA